MARNKNPEETVSKILDVSFRLFQEKGYDHTTIQDITDALGMSKGAVYHHFKSKEDILDNICDKFYERDWFQIIRKDPGASGLEKLRSILVNQLSDPQKLEVDQLTSSLKLNPRLLALILNSTMEAAAPFCLGLVEEGIRDGSITTAYPKELTEVFMLLMNVWLGIFSQGQEDFMQKLGFLKELLEKMGMPLLDDALMAVADGYFAQVMEPQLCTDVPRPNPVSTVEQ